MPEPEVDREEWLHMYEQMAKIRAFEEQEIGRAHV